MLLSLLCSYISKEKTKKVFLILFANSFTFYTLLATKIFIGRSS
jgi:hypothetical protein